MGLHGATGPRFGQSLGDFAGIDIGGIDIGGGFGGGSGGGSGGNPLGFEQLSGLAGFAAGPYGVPASLALSGLFKGIGSLFGNKGRRRRLREAEAMFKQLSTSEIDEGALSRGSALFERSQQPTLERLFSQSAQRVGLDSGIGQGVALGSFQDILAAFNTQQLRDEQNRVERRRLTGAQGLLSLADI